MADDKNKKDKAYAFDRATDQGLVNPVGVYSGQAKRVAMTDGEFVPQPRERGYRKPLEPGR